MVTIPSFSSVPGAAIPGTIRPGLVQHATAATSYPFYGHVKLWYWDYVDISTQEILIAVPGTSRAATTAPCSRAARGARARPSSTSTTRSASCGAASEPRLTGPGRRAGRLVSAAAFPGSHRLGLAVFPPASPAVPRPSWYDASRPKSSACMNGTRNAVRTYHRKLGQWHSVQPAPCRRRACARRASPHSHVLMAASSHSPFPAGYWRARSSAHLSGAAMRRSRK